jgi:predicted transcriptional regulator
MGNNITQVGNLLQIEFDSSFQPAIRKMSGGKYLQWGEHNSHPNYLLELYNRDAVHGAIIKAKADHVYGRGLCYDESKLTLAQQAQYDKFLSHANRFEDWNSLFRKNVTPFEIFDGIALQIVYDFNGKIAEVYNQEFSKFRRSPDGKTLFYCEQWVDDNGCVNDQAHKHKSFIEYPIFNPNIRTGTQILYYKTEVMSAMEFGNIYPAPNYQQGLQDIETNIEITNFNYSHLKNGMFASAMLSLFNGEPTQEEQRKYAKFFDRKFKGSSNTGKMMFNFVDKGGQKAELTTFSQSDLDKMFEQVAKRSQQNIFTAHRTDPALAAIFDGSVNIGDNTIYLQKFERWLFSYIEHRQEIHLNIIKDLAAVNGVDLSLLEIKQKQPANVDLPFDTALLQSLFDLDTLREHYAKKLGIDIKDKVTVDGDMADIPENQVNNHIQKMPAKQWRDLKNLLKSVRDGKTEKSIAIWKLKTSYNLTDQDINVLFATPEAQFSKFDKLVDMTDFVLELFEKNSLEDNDDEIISEEFVSFENNTEAFKFEFEKHKFVTDTEKQVLDLLKGAPETTPEKTAKILGLDVETVKNIINSLVVAGLISTINNTITITPKGLETNTPTIETELYTVYKYVKRPDAPDLVPGGKSRVFCQKMLLLSKIRSWTSNQIDDISNAFGDDAWSFRGGWYSEPKKDGGKTTKYCRHIWKAITKSRTKK